MKCPKCGYLGFEAVDRCRNCGYEFSLSGTGSPPELTLRTSGQDREAPLVDLALVDAAMEAAEASLPQDLYASRGTRAEPLAELPLFGGSASDDDRPLIAKPSAPRTPLSVRRATPETPRLRSEPRAAAAMELSLPGMEPSPQPARRAASPAAVTEVREPAPIRRAVAGTAAPAEAMPAQTGVRVAAALIDFSILGAIDLLVIYLTMKICGLTPAQLALLPKAPLAAFLLLQNLSYFVAFTAGGQTLGKMSTGIKVVTELGNSPDFAHALKRTLIWAVLALPAGLGFLSALLAADRRGLHDRMAETRVVRVTV